MTATPRLVALRRPADDCYLAALRAIWDAGDAVLPLPDDPSQASHVARALQPHVVIDHGVVSDGPAGTTRAGDVGQTAPLPPDSALVVATSGSSGEPKGVVLSHRAVQAAVSASVERLETRADDRWLCCLPLHHVAGLLVLLRGDAAPGDTVVLRRFDVAQIRDVLDRKRPPTLVSLVPTMLHRLLHAGVDVGGFRTILLGGAAAPRRLLDRAAAAGANVVTSYGMTETCGGVVYDGVPVDGVGVALEPDGRILLSGPTLLSGYRSGPPPKIQHGWLPTEDYGRWDGRGRLEVGGRLDSVIVTGGEKVNADAIVRVLEQHPDVEQAAARGVPDEEWGERVEAWVTGVDPRALQAVLEFARSRLPAAAVPKRLHLVDAFPQTGLEKVAVTALNRLPVIGTWPPA